ncbi:MAG: maleylpyruvate isomerase family mycothiol-dependent enzyme, partial [Mycobacterium sp.]
MDFRAALIDETGAFGELIREADPATRIPTCPDWTIKQLFRHVGRGNRWAAQIVADRRDEALDPREVREGKPPDDPEAAIDWLNDGAQLILDSVDTVGADTPVWTFIGPRPAHWWIRRRLHEATVHRADAALALGTDYQLTPEVAADGIDEWLERIAVVANAESSPLDAGQTLHLHATDDGLGAAGEWTITGGDDGVAWSHEHGKGDAALRGSAK